MWLTRKYRNMMRRSDVQNSLDMFQIIEHGGELWFRYNNALVCPCSMFILPPVEAVRKMRELYIKRNYCEEEQEVPSYDKDE